MAALKRAFPLLLLVAAGIGVALLLLNDPGTEGEGEAFGRTDGEAGSGGELDASGSATLTGTSTGVRPARSAGSQPADDTPRRPTFPLEEGIQGRVVDARQRPIAGALLTLHPFPLEDQWWGMPDAEALAETTSAKDGSFVIGPAPVGRLKVRAAAAGFAPSIVPVARRGARVELVLDVGGGLSVKVVNGQGQPISDVTVHHFATGGGPTPPVTTTALTSASGVATFEGVPTGTGSVLATKQGLGAVRQQDVGVAPGGKSEVTVVLAGGRELVGTVTNADDKRPVRGASIEIHYPYVPGLKPSAPVASDEDGRYRVPIDVSQHEQFELRARHADFSEARQWLNYNDSGDGTMKADVQLGKGSGGYTGRVLASDGGAAAGTTVSYGNLMKGQTAPTATTDAEGRFELAAPGWAQPGSQWFLIATSATGGVGSAHAALPGKSDARGKPVEIRLTASSVVEGTVKDGAGEPSSGAAVSMQLDWNAMQNKARTGGRAFDWMSVQALNDPRMQSRLAAVTDATGRFRIEGVPAASYQVEATWGGLSATLAEPLDVQAGSPAKADLVVGEGAVIEGVVLDGEERPVPGAQVWAQPQDQRPGSSPRWSSARSQSDGRFTLRNVGTGAYTLSAQASGYASDSARNVTPGTRDAILRMKGLGWVEGRVTLNGEPLAGAFTVTATRSGGGDRSPRVREGNMMRGDDGSGEARSQLFSSLDGSFILRGLAGGDWLLSATTPEGLVVIEPAAVGIADGRGSGPVSLALLRGTVVLAEVEGADGRPLTNAWVWASAAKSEASRPNLNAGARTDERGAVRLKGLGAGAYTLGVNTDQGVTWSEPLDLQLGEERQVKLRERLPGRVRFVVVDAEGNPLAKATPVLTDANGNQSWPNWQLLRRDGLLDTSTRDAWERATTTDASGGLLRHHVPPGRYRASAALSGFSAPADAPWIEVGSGAVTEVTVTLTASADR